METPKNWPPSKRVPIEEQSRIIEKVDALIAQQKKALAKAEQLRMVLLLGWRYWHDHQQYGHLMRNEGRYSLKQRAYIGWKKIKDWRAKQ